MHRLKAPSGALRWSGHCGPVPISDHHDGHRDGMQALCRQLLMSVAAPGTGHRCVAGSSLSSLNLQEGGLGESQPLQAQPQGCPDHEHLDNVKQ